MNKTIINIVIFILFFILLYLKALGFNLIFGIGSIALAIINVIRFWPNDNIILKNMFTILLPIILIPGILFIFVLVYTPGNSILVFGSLTLFIIALPTGIVVASIKNRKDKLKAWFITTQSSSYFHYNNNSLL